MVALAIVATALVALLGLHHQSLQSVIRSQAIARAGLLAQRLMTDAELQRFPDLGRTAGDFRSIYPGQYENFRWERMVDPSGIFPDVRKVTVRIFYGPGFGRRLEVVEFMHSPYSPQQQQPGR